MVHFRRRAVHAMATTWQQNGQPLEDATGLSSEAKGNASAGTECYDRQRATLPEGAMPQTRP